MKQISINKEDATHIYEWFVGLAHPDLDDCWACQHIVGRLQKFIGPKSVRWVKRQVKKNPYRKP